MVTELSVKNTVILDSECCMSKKLLPVSQKLVHPSSFTTSLLFAAIDRSTHYYNMLGQQLANSNCIGAIKVAIEEYYIIKVFSPVVFTICTWEAIVWLSRTIGESSDWSWITLLSDTNCFLMMWLLRATFAGRIEVAQPFFARLSIVRRTT